MSQAFTHDPDSDNTDKIWEKWKDQFFKEIRTFIPCLTVSGQSSKASCRSPPWFNKEILQIVRTKNRLFKRACRSNKPVHWEVYRRARNHSTTAMRRDKSFSGLEKSAAIRPFATIKSRLASEKILLADSLATESCRLADRLAAKLFFKADNADADRT